jgi:hypothetical protein
VLQHLNEQADLNEYFYSHRSWFFGTMAFIQVVDFGDALSKAGLILSVWVRNTGSQSFFSLDYRRLRSGPETRGFTASWLSS